MSILADTNILLRRLQPQHDHSAAAVASVTRHLESGEEVFITPQNLFEFWNVATRPASKDGLGYSPARALEEVENIERNLTLLPDIPAILPEWKRLVSLHSVSGVQVHDTRLVASMNVHRVRRILTFNARDFKRFDIEVIMPSA